MSNNNDLDEAFRLGKELAAFLDSNRVSMKETNNSLIITRGSETFIVTKNRTVQLQQKNTFR
jgi:hypothetical protein